MWIVPTKLPTAIACYTGGVGWPMRHFVDLDGRRYHCRDGRDLVAAMHGSAFTKDGSDTEFMREMAKRTEMFTGHPYRTDSFKNFVADLIAAGIVREEQC